MSRPDAIDNVASESEATSAWANAVADAVNELSDDLYGAGGAVAAPAGYLTPATPATFRIYVGTATPTGASEGDIWIKG